MRVRLEESLPSHCRDILFSIFFSVEKRVRSDAVVWYIMGALVLYEWEQINDVSVLPV